jgi:hypothetical protein
MDSNLLLPPFRFRQASLWVSACPDTNNAVYFSVLKPESCFFAKFVGRIIPTEAAIDEGFFDASLSHNFGSFEELRSCRSGSSSLPYFTVIFDAAVFVCPKKPTASGVRGRAGTNETDELS